MTTLIMLHLHTCKWKEKQLLTAFKYIHLSSLPTECAQQSTPTSLPPVLEATDVCACHTDKTLNCYPCTDVKLLHLEAPSGEAEFLLLGVHLNTV